MRILVDTSLYISYVFIYVNKSRNGLSWR